MHKLAKRFSWLFPLCFAILGAAPLLAFGADRSGKDVVASVCISCHGSGKNGAPKIGDQPAWTKRASRGLDQLANHAITGLRNMPAHGGNATLSDLEISRAIVYMVTNGKGGEPNQPFNNTRAISGVIIVHARCEECHLNGNNGAPRIGDMTAWKPRLGKGIPTLVKSAIHGHNSMPSRGGLASLSDADMQGAVEYMVTQTANSAIKESSTIKKSVVK